MPSTPLRSLFVSIIALTFVFLIYARSLQGPYLFDDLQAFGGDLNRVEFPTISQWAWPPSRPLLQFWFSLISDVFSPAPFVYRVIGVVIHCLNALLIARLIARIHNSPILRNEALPLDGRTVGIVVSLVWLVHPVAMQAVASIIQQAELLASSFMLIYLLVVTKLDGLGKWQQLASLVVLFILGIESKITMLAAVPAGLTIDALINNRTLIQTIQHRPLVHGLPLSIALFLAIAFVPMLLRSEGGVGFGGEAPPIPIYALTQIRSLAGYISLVIFPDELSIDYAPDFVSSIDVLNIYTCFFLAYLALSYILWNNRLVKRPTTRLMGALLILPLILIAPTSSVVPTADPFFEHRIYLAMAFWIWFLVLLATVTIARLPLDMESRRRVYASLLTFVLLTLSLRTYVRSGDYSSAQAIWLSALNVDPHNKRASQNLASWYANESTDEALDVTWQNLVRSATFSGKNHDAVLHEVARLELRKGNPVKASAILSQLAKRVPKIETTFTDRQRREAGEVWFDLAISLAQTGNETQAISAMQQCLRTSPNDPFAHSLIADIYALTGDKEKESYHRVLANEFSSTVKQQLE